MKVLITGGAGFIGRNLAQRLIDEGHEVVILDNLSPQIHGDKATFDQVSAVYSDAIFGEITSRNDVAKSVKGADVIVHYAAETGTGQSMYEMTKYSQVNVVGTTILLEEVLKTKSVKKVLVASSRAVYGEGRYFCETHGDVYPNSRREEDLLAGDFNVKCPKCKQNATLSSTDEESKAHPSSIYGVTKLSQEQLIISASEAMGIPWVSLRYQNVYGPGQSLKNPYTGILSIFSTLILNNKPINIFEDGEESRDFVFIDDVVEATYLSIVSENSNNEIFNVGSGSSQTVLEVANSLNKLYNADVELNISGNFRLGDIRHNYADLSKIQSALGYLPRISFQDGLTKFTKWVKGQEVESDKYEDSLNQMKEKGLFK